MKTITWLAAALALLSVAACGASAAPEESVSAEALAKAHVGTNSASIAQDLAVELTGEHWLLKELGVDWLTVRIVDGIEWTYTKPEDKAGVVEMASTAIATIPISHDRLDKDYQVQVSTPYILAVDLDAKTVEATPDYLAMTMTHDLPALPDLTGKDMADAADTAKGLLKKLGED